MNGVGAKTGAGRVQCRLVSFDSLRLYRYAVRLVFERGLDVPTQGRGVLFRGAFGTEFRRLACHDVELDCKECMLRASCPYAAAFRPELTLPDVPIARLREPPRPFVLSDPLPEANALPAGMPVTLALTVVGGTHRLLPHFAATLRRLGEVGMGRHRTRFRVESIHAVDVGDVPREEIWREGGSMVRALGVPMTAKELARPGDAEAKRVRVRYRTATLLRADGVPQERPSFGVLVRRLRDRVSALAFFYGEGALDVDVEGLASKADGITTVVADFRRAAWMRTSARTKQKHPIEGVLGEAVYEGEGLGELMPLLRLGELLHVGKHASFGNGKIDVEVLG